MRKASIRVDEYNIDELHDVMMELMGE